MNNNISSTNFKGTFLVNYKNTLPGMRKALEEKAGKHGKIIFENFEGKDSVLYVLRNSKDYDVANFIKKNELRFKYMPEIDTKLQFESDAPEKVEEYISKYKPKVIRKISEMIDFVTNNRQKNKAIKDSHISFYDKILTNLKINIVGQKQKNSKGIMTIKDDKGGFVCISPKSKNGFSYVYSKPSNSYDDIMRYAIDENGNVVRTFQDPDAITKFSENFNKAVKHHLHLE